MPERCLHHLPDQLSFLKAALTEPCCVAYNATCVNGRVRPGDHVLVIGPGPIGLLCAQMAKLSGAGHLIVSGLPVDERWESINNRALALAAQVIAVIILVVFLVTEYEGGDAMPYALLEAAFAAAYFGGILWYRWRQ